VRFLNATQVKSSLHLRGIDVDLDGLGLQILVETLETALTTVPGLLNTTEWSVWCREIPIVDSNGASFHVSCDTKGSANGAGVDAGRQTILCAVGELDGLLFGLEGVDGDDRAEDLFLDDSRTGGSVLEDGGFNVKTG